MLLPWSFRELGAVEKILGPLTEILEGVLQADQQLMEKTKAKVFSAFITVLQMKELRGEPQLQLGRGIFTPGVLYFPLPLPLPLGTLLPFVRMAHLCDSTLSSVLQSVISPSTPSWC
jgi:hypothetical protein